MGCIEKKVVIMEKNGDIITTIVKLKKKSYISFKRNKTKFGIAFEDLPYEDMKICVAASNASKGRFINK